MAKKVAIWLLAFALMTPFALTIGSVLFALVSFYLIKRDIESNMPVGATVTYSPGWSVKSSFPNEALIGFLVLSVVMFVLGIALLLRQRNRAIPINE